MGLIGKVLGGPAATTALGGAVSSVAEVFTPNATKKMEADAAAYLAALDEHGAEFQFARPGLFDRLVNGLNRLPRPMLALGTLGLFVYAMVEPVGFAQRMVGLNYVPEPLWWLLGAIVGFYFGAREAHYYRNRTPVPTDAPQTVAGAVPTENPALKELLARDGP
ncbi:holin (3TMs family) [Rhodobacter sp. JA431]|uniref:holin family protein n=1 Tax=Rhodobacter sp. JA431 TaxID=570013 RepID=UPI000BC82E3F|nr:holin family protein [Rhodobacter sp. JA431]SOB92153.1 holin (3TMs family) [Rhodobacter sp. JA431]